MGKILTTKITILGYDMYYRFDSQMALRLPRLQNISSSKS